MTQNTLATFSHVCRLLLSLHFFLLHFSSSLSPLSPMFSLFLPHPHPHNESPQPESLCSDLKYLLSCKLVSDDLPVCWNHTRERETDVEIEELGELVTEMLES